MAKDNTKKIEDLQTLVAILLVAVFGILFSGYLIFAGINSRLDMIECALGIGDISKCITRPGIILPPSGEVFEGHWECIEEKTVEIYSGNKNIHLLDFIDCDVSRFEIIERVPKYTRVEPFNETEVFMDKDYYGNCVIVNRNSEYFIVVRLYKNMSKCTRFAWVKGMQ